MSQTILRYPFIREGGEETDKTALGEGIIAIIPNTAVNKFS